MNEKIIEKKQVKIMVCLLLFCIMMFCGFHLLGGLKWICDKVADVGLCIAGYEEQIYVVEMETISAVPIYRDNYVEQEIYLTSDVADADSLMLEITIGVYGRINTGSLYVQISQGDASEVYSIDLTQVPYDKRLNLISYNTDWEVGNLYVKLYAPHSSEENCVGIYVEQSLDVYSELVVNGEKTFQNACINLSIPSKEAKVDFLQESN